MTVSAYLSIMAPNNAPNSYVVVFVLFPSNIVAYDLIYVKGHIQDLVDDLRRITYFLRGVCQDLGMTENKKLKATICDKK